MREREREIEREKDLPVHVPRIKSKLFLSLQIKTFHGLIDWLREREREREERERKAE